MDNEHLNVPRAHFSAPEIASAAPPSPYHRIWVNLLRTLALDTDLVLLDEPLNGLDFLSIQRVIAALKEKQQEGKAILMISHNEEIFEAVIPVENSYYLDFAGGV